MRKLLHWLNKNRKLNLLIAGLFFIFIVFLHEESGKWIAQFDRAYGRAAYDLLMMAIAFTVGGFVLGITFRKFIHHDERLYGLIFTAITYFLAAAVFQVLIVVNVEAIHFLQYGGLAFLLFPVFKRYGETIFWVALLGAIDEYFQFINPWYPRRLFYYDFNDVVLNTLGAAMGVAMAWSANTRLELPQRSSFLKSPTLRCALGLFVFFGFLFYDGMIQVYPSDPACCDCLVLYKKSPKGFWTTVPPNITFHIMKPLEGTLITLFLWIGYGAIDYRKRD